jgi:hypothetical protein
MMVNALAGIAGIFDLMENGLLMSVMSIAGNTPNATICAATIIPQLTIFAAICAMVKFALLILVMIYWFIATLCCTVCMNLLI